MSYLPFTVMVPLDAATRGRVAAVLPFTAAMTALDGQAAAYVCRNFACERPVTTAADLRSALGRPAPGAGPG
jgi:hypothetical protein